MSFKSKVSLAVAALAFTAVLFPQTAFAEPAPPPSPVAPAGITAADIATDALTALEKEIAEQEKIAAKEKATQQRAAEAAAKKAAEEKAAAEAQEKLRLRNADIKGRLGLTDDAFAKLTEDDLQNLAVKPCTESKDVTYSNGQLPKEALCNLTAKNHSLRPHAAVAFEAMSKAFERKFSEPLCLTDSYRTLAVQRDLKLRKPVLAAVPGTSNHGWGLAVDLCGDVSRFNTEEHEWLRLHGPSFGWDNPKWARQNGSKPESWHWEYVAVEHEDLPL